MVGEEMDARSMMMCCMHWLGSFDSAATKRDDFDWLAAVVWVCNCCVCLVELEKEGAGVASGQRAASEPGSQ